MSQTLAIASVGTTSVKGKGKVKTASKAQGKKNKPAKVSELKAYAYAGVGVMSALSAVLNGYANAQHSPSAIAGWMMGISIPIIILILGKVAGLLYKGGYRQLAYLTASAGVSLLVLSVWHCATSIAILTGSSVFLALPMAVAIDVGFVSCELSALVAR